MRTNDQSLMGTAKALKVVDALLFEARRAGTYTAEPAVAVPVLWLRAPLFFLTASYGAYILINSWV
jgi:hypothetical protein